MNFCGGGWIRITIQSRTETPLFSEMTATFSEEEQVSPEIAIQDLQPANEFYQPLGDDPFASEDSAPEEALDSAPGECDREAFCFHVSNDDAYIPEGKMLHK